MTEPNHTGFNPNRVSGRAGAATEKTKLVVVALPVVAPNPPHAVCEVEQAASAPRPGRPRKRRVFREKK